MSRKQKINVLLVYANPINTPRLRLDTEAREIQQAIQRSKYRDNFNIVLRPAATIEDLSRLLLEDTFRVVHIAGHGTRSGLLLANEQGGQYAVHPPTLAELFELYPSIECVQKNACYSTLQGQLLRSVPYTIAMEGPLIDNAAIAFSSGFYDALGAGKPVDFAYKQGRLQVKFRVSPSIKLPTLIGNGRIIFPENAGEQISEVSERTYIKAGKYLVGFAIDLSGSMDESIHNQSDVSVSRLNSLDQSFSSLIKNARESIQESRARKIETSLDLFVYGFGLRSMPVCDLLSLIKAGREVITDEIIRTYTESYKKEQQIKYGDYEGTAEIAQSLGLDGLWSIGEGWAKRLGKGAVLKRILRDLRPMLEARVKEIGDTTQSFEELVQLWETSEITLSNIRDLIFGDTPVKEVLEAIVARFQRELQNRDQTTQSILFLVSDGKFTGTDPLPLAKQLQSLGVKIVSCFISDQDTANPRELRDTVATQWGPEAKLMFELASPMGELPEVRRYLFQNGWTIYSHPKLFVQLNHSDVLREFVRVTLSMLEDSEAAQTLPKGW